MSKGKVSVLSLVVVILLGASTNPVRAEDRSAIFFNLASQGNPAQVTMVVTDPQGRRAGVNVISHVEHHEIPGESFGFESVGNDETGEPASDETMELELHGISSGRYLLTVYSSTSALVSLRFGAYDLNGNIIKFDGQPFPEERLFMSVGGAQSFTLDYSPQAGSSGSMHKEATFSNLRLSLQTALRLGQLGDAKFVAKLDKILAEGEKALSKGKKKEAVEKLREFIKKLEKAFKGEKDDDRDEDDKDHDKKHAEKEHKKPAKRFVSETAFKSLKSDAEALIAGLGGKPGKGNKDD